MYGAQGQDVSISIHAPREGGDFTKQEFDPWRDISIHAPREGGDNDVAADIICTINISIHAPREGGDH